MSCDRYLFTNIGFNFTFINTLTTTHMSPTQYVTFVTLKALIVQCSLAFKFLTVNNAMAIALDT